MDTSWTDQLSAWSTLATAVFTAALALFALIAWRTAKKALEASQAASVAAEASANAAREANQQSKFDSIEQTRPYVYVELMPGLAGATTWDIRIANSGRSAARKVTVEYDGWPDQPDDVARSVKELFDTERTLPPGCSIRAVWRLEGNFTDGTKVAGLGTSGKLRVRYSSDDPSRQTYEDVFDVMIDNSGMWPIPEQGPDPNGIHDAERKFYKLGPSPRSPGR